MVLQVVSEEGLLRKAGGRGLLIQFSETPFLRSHHPLVCPPFSVPLHGALEHILCVRTAVVLTTIVILWPSNHFEQQGQGRQWRSQDVLDNL